MGFSSCRQAVAYSWVSMPAAGSIWHAAAFHDACCSCLPESAAVSYGKLMLLRQALYHRQRLGLYRPIQDKQLLTYIHEARQEFTGAQCDELVSAGNSAHGRQLQCCCWHG